MSNILTEYSLFWDNYIFFQAICHFYYIGISRNHLWGKLLWLNFDKNQLFSGGDRHPFNFFVFHILQYSVVGQWIVRNLTCFYGVNIEGMCVMFILIGTFIFLIIVLYLSAFYSGAETVYSSVNKIRLRYYVSKNKKAVKKLYIYRSILKIRLQPSLSVIM